MTHLYGEVFREFWVPAGWVLIRKEEADLWVCLGYNTIFSGRPGSPGKVREGETLLEKLVPRVGMRSEELPRHGKL